MAQRIGQKTVNTFIKGLITEAGEMTFPEGASTDELNCQLNRDGTRSRRLGVEIEDNNVVEASVTALDTEVFSTSIWKNAGGQAGFDYLVVQHGDTLSLYGTASEPFSSLFTGSTIDLKAFEYSGSAGAGSAKIEVASINGDLIVTSSAINPFYVTLSGSTITTTTINIKVRDFEWLGDTTTYYTSDSTPDIYRQYDARNTGWGQGGGPADYTKPLTHPWYAGKDADGNYSETEWNKIYAGNTLTGNGHYLLDFFSKDRSAISGVSGLPTEVESTRFQAVAAFSGRVFYSGLTSSKNSGKVLFSKQLDNISEAGRCYQQNDPTAEDFSDLLDTDGGVILIPDAMNIQKLYPLGGSLFVFAENGIWSITGVDNVFRATEYSVQKVTSVGMFNPKAFVEVEGIPLWWSKQGIHTFTFEAGTGRPSEQTLSISTIQRFFDDIDNNAKSNCVGVYDAINKRVFWFYPKNNETSVHKKQRVLILDVALQAFYPWEISDDSVNGYEVVDAVYMPGQGSDYIDSLVVAGSGVGDPVVAASALDSVFVPTLSFLAESNAAIVLLVDTGAGLTMATFRGKNFLDWGTDNYTSYAETGYDFVGDAILKKTAPYLLTYCRVSEEGWDTSGNPTRPSSLLVSAYWDFSKSASTSTQQAYRYKKAPIATGNPNDFGYPDTVISTRLKVRGTGRSMRLRFESEEGKDFILIGYGVIQGANQRF